MKILKFHLRIMKIIEFQLIIMKIIKKIRIAYYSQKKYETLIIQCENYESHEKSWNYIRDSRKS